MPASNSEPYEDLTTHGEHAGGTPREPTGSSVRAQQGHDPEGGASHEREAVFQLMRTEDDGDVYRIRTWPPRAVVDETDEGFETVDTYTAVADARQAVHDLPHDTYHVVLEHESGKITVHYKESPPYSWAGDASYTCVSLFTDDGEASEYADARREEMSDTE